MMFIKNVKIHLENKIIENGALLTAGDKIQKIYDTNAVLEEISSDAVIINGEGKNLIPGFIDGHIHGADGADVMDATEAALDKIAKVLPVEGTTSFLATTITQSVASIEKALNNVSTYHVKPRTAELIGIHLEGPFIERSMAGAQPIEHILKPNVDLFHHWQSLSNDKIKTITIAPEHDPEGTFIRFLKKSGVNVSAGHTKSSYIEMKESVKHGINQVTHICNAMSGIHHRDIGVVGAALRISELRAELIADGIHVSNEMMQLIYDNMGSERLLLITDSMRAKCLSSGEYELGGQPVIVSNDRAILKDGTLAGSILKMCDGARNVMNLNNVKMKNIIEMASSNPARQVGIFHKKGSIVTGKDADLLLVDDNLHIHYTICRGRIAYKEGEFFEDSKGGKL